MLSRPALIGRAVEKLNALRKELAAYAAESLAKLFPELREEIAYMVLGGKFLRGALSLFVAETLGCTSSSAFPIALAVELMHAASLVYDDIADSSATRRGQPSFWRKYGIDEAVTVPHVAMATAISLIAQYGGRDAVVESMSAWRLAALGQIWDLRIRRGWKGVATYRQLVSAKTGAVFGAALALPLYPAGRVGLVGPLREFGLRLGAAYQVVDDLTDLSSGVTDSGSAMLLLREAGSGYVEHGVRLLRQLLSEACALEGVPEELWAVGIGTLRIFSMEAAERVRERVGEVLREFEGGSGTSTQRVV